MNMLNQLMDNVAVVKVFIHEQNFIYVSAYK